MEEYISWDLHGIMGIPWSEVGIESIFSVFINIIVVSILSFKKKRNYTNQEQLATENRELKKELERIKKEQEETSVFNNNFWRL